MRVVVKHYLIAQQKRYQTTKAAAQYYIKCSKAIVLASIYGYWYTDWQVISYN